MIEKLVKEFEKIYASLGKSKKLILADIDKIDEKYRKLAQEEKKNLTESLAILNEQMKYYSTILGGNAGEAKDEVEEEPAIEDTIFPENNVQEEKVETTATVEKIEEPVFETTETETENEPKEETKTIEEPDAADVVPADNSATTDDVAVEWPDNAVVEEKEVKKEEDPVAVFTTDDNGWPIPDDWK